MALIETSFSTIPRHAFHGLIPLTLCVAVGLGCALGSYWLFLAPSRSRIETAHAAYETARLTHAQRIEAKRIQERVRHSQHDLEAVWTQLPTQRQFPALAVAISEFGHHVGVSIPGMTYSTQPSQTGLALEGALRFRAVGEYADIYRFIHRLETSPSYLVIESLEVTTSGRNSASGKSLIELNVRVVTFLRPDASTPRES